MSYYLMFIPVFHHKIWSYIYRSWMLQIVSACFTDAETTMQI